jgi:hypothetical protein
MVCIYELHTPGERLYGAFIKPVLLHHHLGRMDGRYHQVVNY